MLQKLIKAIILCLGLFGVLYAQPACPATWYTTTNGLDTGFLRLHNMTVRSVLDFSCGYAASSKDLPRTFSFASVRDFQWVAVGADTVLWQAPETEELIFRQLCLRGAVSLYRAHPVNGPRTFYWRDQRGHWHALRQATVADIARELISEECARFDLFVDGLSWGEPYLMQLTKHLNKCLGSESHRPLLSWHQGRNEVVASLVSPMQSAAPDNAILLVDPISSFHVAYRRRFPRFAPWLSIQVLARWWSYDYEGTNLLYLAGRGGLFNAPYEEELSISQAYISFGGLVTPLVNRRWSPFVGAGIVYAVPLEVSREVKALGVRNLGGTNGALPAQQLIEGGLQSKLGLYWEYGVRFAISTHWKISASIYTEHVAQPAGPYGRALQTDFFRSKELLLPNRNAMWQLSVARSW